MDFSPRSFKARHCGGKLQYKRRKLALSKMAESRKFDAHGDTLNVYKCFYGAHFHIGHAPLALWVAGMSLSRMICHFFGHFPSLVIGGRRIHCRRCHLVLQRW